MAPLGRRPECVALCHWNANVDNAWFWRDADNVLNCGLMDWGCVSQMNVGMAIWGAMSGAETDLWNHHLDDLLHVFVAEVDGTADPTSTKASYALTQRYTRPSWESRGYSTCPP